MAWNTLASEDSINRTLEALQANGMNVVVVENGEEAKQKVLALIPKSSEVMTMTSVTLESIGLEKAINESGEFTSVKAKLASMNRETQGSEMQKLGAAPDYTVGSVHAVTEDGKVIVASNTGSQLPAYAYGSSHVIWVVGTQKIVANLDEAMKRIDEHVVPLEDERALKAYGMHTALSKLLIFNREINPQRITIVLVKEVLGF